MFFGTRVNVYELRLGQGRDGGGSGNGIEGIAYILPLGVPAAFAEHLGLVLLAQVGQLQQGLHIADWLVGGVQEKPVVMQQVGRNGRNSECASNGRICCRHHFI